MAQPAGRTAQVFNVKGKTAGIFLGDRLSGPLTNVQVRLKGNGFSRAMAARAAALDMYAVKLKTKRKMARP